MGWGILPWKQMTQTSERTGQPLMNAPLQRCGEGSRSHLSEGRSLGLGTIRGPYYSPPGRGKGTRKRNCINRGVLAGAKRLNQPKAGGREETEGCKALALLFSHHPISCKAKASQKPESMGSSDQTHTRTLSAQGEADRKGELAGWRGKRKEHPAQEGEA